MYRREHVSEREPERGKDLASDQRRIRAYLLHAVAGGVDLCPLLFRVDYPGQSNARLEVIVQLQFDLRPGVALAQHLHRQVGHQFGDRVVRELVPGYPSPRDEAHVGDADQAEPEPKGRGAARHHAKSELLGVVPDHPPEVRSVESFPGPHRLLHEDAVDQFADALVLSVQQAQQVLLGGHAGERLHPNAVCRDPSQAVDQVGNTFQLWSDDAHARNPRSEATYAAYLARSLSRYFLLSAVTSHARGQKHRSIVHQSCGTPLACMAGISLSKFSLPVPNGLCVEVLCSFRLPSESIRWMCVTLPFNFSSSSSSPPLSVSFWPDWLAPTAAHMCAWQLSNRTPKLVFPLARTPSTILVISDGLLNTKPGSNSQHTLSA